MLNTIRTMITGVLPDVWPVIIIITVIACSIRLAYIINNNKEFCFYKELFMLLFVIYVMCLFEIVTVQDYNYGSSNFIPFHEIFRYEVGSRLFVKNILGNILLFLPYGYFVTSLVNNRKFWPTALLTIIISITIEIVQLNIGRTFDIDDVILNTCGGVLGYYLYRFGDLISERLPKIFKTEGFINFFIIAFLIFAIIFIFNINLVDLIH